MHCALPAVSFVLFLAIGSSAQTPAATDSFGVSHFEGAVRAGGPDYTATFRATGAAFTALPGRGRDAATVHLRAVSVARGDDVTMFAVAEPTIAGQEVHYARAWGITEVYAARADGIEQSFVFANRPAGSGDLVVRVALTTDLPLTAANDGGLRFERAGAGVTFGGVTGIDANGATRRGGLHVRGDVLELSLPAAFVDNAVYPLVLDPLIGSAFTVGNAAGGVDVQPAVAFDATLGRYLVVWNVEISATVAEVRGQLVTSSGTVLGSQMLFSVAGIPGERPSVASCNVVNRFLVGYIRRGSTTGPGGTMTFPVLEAVAVNAANGAQSTASVVAGGAFLVAPSQVAVGGDSRTFVGNGRALVVHRTHGITINGNQILAHVLEVQPTGAPIPLATTSLASSPNNLGDPAVSVHGGSAGNAGKWVVAFGQSVVGPTAPFTRIYAHRVDLTGNACGTPQLLRNSPGSDLRRPSVATRDGFEFVVAWEDATAQRIDLRQIVWTGTCASGSWSSGPLRNPVVQTGAQTAPAVAFAKDKYLLAWSQTVSSVAKVYVKGLEPDFCTACGAELRTDTTLIADVTPAIVSRWEGSDQTSDEALVVWANGSIRARRVEARGTGDVASLGGACFAGGSNDFATYSGRPVLGDDTFALELLAPTAPIAALVIGFSAGSFACGSCTLVPAPDLVLAGITPTPVPIPCAPELIGAELYTQWLLLKPSDCPLLPFLANSNTLKFTIAE